jgi:gas vesicle protein
MNPSDELLKNLERNLPIVQEEAAVAVMTEPQKNDKEVQDDYDFSRKSYRDLVDTSNKAIEAMLNLALQSEHPRAFEVLSAMLKNTSEITDKLMDLQKKKQDVKREAPVHTGGTTTNNVFIGSTSELQKHLIKKLAEKNVTDTATVATPTN